MDFKIHFNEAVQPLSELLRKFPWENRGAYTWFLAQTYFYTRHSTKLLTLSSSRFSHEDYDLHRRFIVHSQEERGHEFMAQKDISVLGGSIDDFFEQTSTAAFYQRQYYLIEHVDPICFLGYVLCLEGLAASAAGYARDQVKAAHGEKASLFLRAHSDEDPDHIEKAFKALDGLSKERLELVRDNMMSSASLYRQMILEAIENANKASRFKKAA